MILSVTACGCGNIPPAETPTQIRHGPRRNRWRLAQIRSEIPGRRFRCIGLSAGFSGSFRAPVRERKHQSRTSSASWAKGCAGMSFLRRATSCCIRRTWIALAREGCTFRNAFVVNALCLPSRATMLTGMYSHTTGAVSNVEGKIPARFPLVSDLLQKAGYETAFLGKSHIEGALMEHNWDYYFGFVGQADYYRPKITEGVRGNYRPAKLYEGEYVDTLLTQKAVEWLKQKRTKPFCLFLWFYAPHAPFYRPKDMVNDLNGVPIPKPATFDEDLQTIRRQAARRSRCRQQDRLLRGVQRRSAIARRTGEGPLCRRPG